MKRVPFIPQMEVSECGAAALAMVLAYHGHHAPLPEVRQACGVGREGASGLALVRAARAYGLEGEGVSLEMEDLAQLPLPAILHWGFHHFVVLERLHRRKAIIVDPSAGRREVAFDEMRQLFTGVAFIFAPDEHFIRRREVRPSLRRYRGLLRRSLPGMLQLFVSSAMLQILGLVFPVATQVLIDHVIAPHQEAWLWGLAAALAAATAGRALLKVVRGWVIQNLVVALDLRLIGGFLDHLLHLPLAFFLQRTPGDLFQRVQSNTTLRDVFTTRTVSALLDGFLVAGYTALMISYSPRLSAVVIILAVPRVVFLIMVRRRNRHYMAAELAAAGRESSVLVEALSVLETIKASGAETDVVGRWGNRLAQRVNASLDRRRLEIASTQLMSVVQGLSMAAVLWFAGREVIDGGMTLGVFAAFLTLQSLFFTPLESLLGGVNQLQYLNSHLFRLDDVLETGREASGTVDPGRLSGAIEVDNVSFAYTPGGPDVVRSVTLHIEPGQKVALVGPTGAGKSTLARLILGMHLPSSGAIRLDGIELREMDLIMLRRQMGVVLQDAFFFSDTINSNVTLGEQVPLERLYAAVSDAGLDQVIDALPDGYATRLAQNGSMLSGGERQRLALARALVRDPAVLLLDEATSALDAESEARVHANLARRGVTRIVITHRLASVEDADRIFVLNGGSIVQHGDFETLLAQGGLFRELVAHPEQTHA